jgi:hypothetical protein
MQVSPIHARVILRIIVDRFHATGAPVDIVPLFSTSSLSEPIVRDAVQYWYDHDALEPCGNDHTYTPKARANDVLNRGSS